MWLLASTCFSEVYAPVVPLGTDSICLWLGDRLLGWQMCNLLHIMQGFKNGCSSIFVHRSVIFKK